MSVRNGVVVEVGHLSGTGAQEIDADGAIVVSPASWIFTRITAKSSWDHRLQPSSWHGVTTVISGNCGVGFAPAFAGDRGKLIQLMEGVEDIPGTALHEGLAWNWVSFPEYLDAISAREFDLDVGIQIAHAPLRVHVMGERAAAMSQATPDEIATISRLPAQPSKRERSGSRPLVRCTTRASRATSRPTMASRRANSTPSLTRSARPARASCSGSATMTIRRRISP